MLTTTELHGGELAEELLFLGAAYAHIAEYYERERLARIDRVSRLAMQRATGGRFRGGVVSFA